MVEHHRVGRLDVVIIVVVVVLYEKMESFHFFREAFCSLKVNVSACWRSLFTLIGLSLFIEITELVRNQAELMTYSLTKKER